MVSAGPCYEGWHCEPGGKSNAREEDAKIRAKRSGEVHLLREEMHLLREKMKIQRICKDAIEDPIEPKMQRCDRNEYFRRILQAKMMQAAKIAGEDAKRRRSEEEAIEEETHRRRNENMRRSEEAKRRRSEDASEEANDISPKMRMIGSGGPATGGRSRMSLAATRHRPVDQDSANFPSNCSETHGVNDHGVNWEEIDLLSDHLCDQAVRRNKRVTITLHHLGIWF
jgi:hypothetical protein